MSQELPPQNNTSGTNTKSEGLLAGLSKSAGAVSKMVAMQAEKTKLSSITLPAAYRALGKDCLQQKRHLECASELTTQLRSVLDEIKQLSEITAGQNAPQSFTDKAKAAGKQALDVARTKQLGIKRDSLIANIGKAIYSTHADNSGPGELVGPIGLALARVSEIEAEIGQQSQIGKGTFVTPKRMLIAAAVAVVLVFAAVGSKDGGDAQFRKELAGEWNSTEGITFTFDDTEIVVSQPGEMSIKSAYSTNFSDRTGSFTIKDFATNLALKEDGRLLAERDGKVLTLRRTGPKWSDDESNGSLSESTSRSKGSGDKSLSEDELKKLSYNEIIFRMGPPDEEYTSRWKSNQRLAIWETGNNEYTVIWLLKAIDGSGETVVMLVKTKRHSGVVEQMKKAIDTPQ